MAYKVEVIKLTGTTAEEFTNKSKAYAYAKEQSKGLNCLCCDVRKNGKIIQTFYKGVKKLWKD